GAPRIGAERAVAAVEAGDEAGAPFRIGVFRLQQLFHFAAPLAAAFTAQVSQEMQRAENFGKPHQARLERRFRRHRRPCSADLANGQPCGKDKEGCAAHKLLWANNLSAARRISTLYSGILTGAD